MADGAWARRSVLVTGAGGFVGSHLAAALADAGARVVAMLRDERAPGSFELLELGGRVTAVRGSVTDAALLERVLAQYEVEACFHLAAQALVGLANSGPGDTFDSNIRGTWTLLEACRRSPRVGRVVVASSDKAYGAQPLLPYTEAMPLLATSPYDASKACTDIIARSYASSFDMPVSVSRCANIYGGGDVNLSRLIPGTFVAALRGERPVIRSDGTPVRDFIHVDDAVEAYLTLGEATPRDGVTGQAFNFGSGDPVSVLGLTAEILQACGRSDLEPDVRGQGPLRNEIDRQYLDSTRAHEVLGWSPRLRRPDGLGATAAWYREHLASLTV